MSELYGEHWWLIFFIGFLITWGIGLVPPLLIRFIILQRPIGIFWSIATVTFFWVFNVLLFSTMDGQNKPRVAIALVAVVSYFILRHGANKKREDHREPDTSKGESKKPIKDHGNNSKTSKSIVKENQNSSNSIVFNLFIIICLILVAGVYYSNNSDSRKLDSPEKKSNTPLVRNKISNRSALQSSNISEATKDAYEKKKWDLLLIYSSEWVDMDKKNYLPWVYKGIAYAQLSQFHNAKTSFEHALQLNPGNKVIIENLRKARERL